MSYSGEAAEQVVRMSLNGVEIAAKLSGKAAERLAALLYAVIKDQKRTKGKVRLTNMLKSGKELKVFAVKDGELEKFSRAAKQYGVLYCVLKDRNESDGLTDVMVRADDAGKVNRIFERFNLASIDMASIKTEIERNRGTGMAEENPAPERANSDRERVDEFMKKVVPEKDANKEKTETENPSPARSAKSGQSGRSSGTRGTKIRTADEERSLGKRPSVRKELEEIRNESKNENNAERTRSNERKQENVHQAPKRKKKYREEKT